MLEITYTNMFKIYHLAYMVLLLPTSFLITTHDSSWLFNPNKWNPSHLLTQATSLGIILLMFLFLPAYSRKIHVMSFSSLKSLNFIHFFPRPFTLLKKSPSSFSLWFMVGFLLPVSSLPILPLYTKVNWSF